MKLLIILLLSTLAAGHPGLLRVPKVYNAVITSNQNLSPSRAFPVIQPVIHRTAIGYVPPFYYTQIAPHFSGPEVVHLPTQSTVKSGEPEAPVSPTEPMRPEKQDDADDGREKTSEKDGPMNGPKKNNDDVPLSFYPNYQSLYYDPYFYAYNGFNPHLVPGTYYIDYQPYGAVAPIPPTPPKEGYSEHLLPGYQDEKKDRMKVEKEKVPDVPPPPVPTAIPKSS